MNLKLNWVKQNAKDRSAYANTCDWWIDTSFEIVKFGKGFTFDFLDSGSNFRCQTRHKTIAMAKKAAQQFFEDRLVGLGLSVGQMLYALANTSHDEVQACFEDGTERFGVYGGAVKSKGFEVRNSWGPFVLSDSELLDDKWTLKIIGLTKAGLKVVVEEIWTCEHCQHKNTFRSDDGHQESYWKPDAKQAQCGDCSETMKRPETK